MEGVFQQAGVFCEVELRNDGVLRSSAQSPNFVPWRTYTLLRQEYAAFVTWLADAA
jgi:hypothetical protein